MAETYYSPTPRVTGGLLSVSYFFGSRQGDTTQKQGAIFFKFAKQTDWNKERKIGSYKGGEIINVKFTRQEIFDLIIAYEKKTKWDFYHSFGSSPVKGTFTYYEQDQGKKKGYGMLVTKDETTIRVGLSEGRAKSLVNYLEWCSSKINEAQDRWDKKQRFNTQKEEAAEPEKEAEEETSVELVPAEQEPENEPW